MRLQGGGARSGAVSQESATRRRYGWTCRLEPIERNGKVYHYWRAYKRVGGRVRSVYIGRDWNREALGRFREKAARIEAGGRVTDRQSPCPGPVLSGVVVGLLRDWTDSGPRRGDRPTWQSVPVDGPSPRTAGERLDEGRRPPPRPGTGFAASEEVGTHVRSLGQDSGYHTHTAEAGLSVVEKGRPECATSDDQSTKACVG